MSRIDEILARADLVVALRRYRSKRAWCLAAKVSPSYFAAMKIRGGQDGTGEVRDVKRETMEKLASYANIDLGWLMGEGAREPVRESSTLLVAPGRTNFDQAFEDFDWPEGITIAQAEAVRARAMAEADATPTARTLPMKLWRTRLQQIASEVMAARSRVQKRTG